MPSEWDELKDEEQILLSKPLKDTKKVVHKYQKLGNFGLEPDPLPPAVFPRTPTRQATVTEVVNSD